VISVRAGSFPAIPVLFWQDRDTFYVILTAHSVRWSSDALGEGGATVALANGQAARCAATLLTDTALADRIRERFRGKYGDAAYGRYFDQHSKILRLDVGAAATRRPDAELLQEEFDAAAPGYAERVDSNPIERYLKETTRDRLLRAFRGSGPLLEVGAGTGFETLPLLGAGHSIVAVDVSPGMLGELATRAEKAGVGARLTCRRGRLSDLAASLEDYGPESLDGAYSTFGAFNLEDRLAAAAKELARVLRPGALLIFTSLQRPGLTAVVWELAVGNPSGARARARGTVPAGVIRYPLRVYLRNPPYWDRALAPHFRRVVTLPVSVLAPPFESSRAVGALGSVGGGRLRRLDEWLSRRALLTPFAEWGFYVYRRSDHSPAPSRLM
jgi:SAM-dependent methyltransferase